MSKLKKIKIITDGSSPTGDQDALEFVPMQINKEIWTFTLEDNTTVTKEVAIWTSQG